MLVAGVDVGNSTTEVALARVEPGRDPEWLLVLRRPTSGPKGSAACAEGVADLVGRAERRLGERPHLLLLAELHPVEASLVELSRSEEAALGRTAIGRPASSTPSGAGVGVGRLRRLAELAGPPAAEPAVAVVAGEDFEEASRRLRDARERGWKIAAAVVKGDDAVLIGNRFDRGIPIVDEVADAAVLPAAAVAAVEVAPAGMAVAELSDPLRIAVLLGLAPEEARAARHAARAVAGHRAAVVVRLPNRAPEPAGREAGVTLVTAGGEEVPLDERAAPPPPGVVTAIRGAAGERGGLLDVVWRRLPAPPDDPGFARRLARRRALAVALLREADGGDLLEAVAPLAAGGARVVARESEAAVLGASTTPGAGAAPSCSTWAAAPSTSTAAWAKRSWPSPRPARATS